MRRGFVATAALAFVAAMSWSVAPSRAMPLSPALKDAGASISLTDKVSCWDGCYYERPYYRPYYRRYYDDGPYYHSYYRPYYRSYYDYGPRYYAPPYRPPWWVSGPYYGPPRPRFYVGPHVYWY